MHNNVKRLNFVINKVKEILVKKQLKTTPQIIAVTKTFPIDQITPLLEVGHIHFGENKVQEAEAKWLQLKNKHKNLQLHMLGKLQTNKVKKAVNLFNYIHSLDNAKLALKISQFEKELNKKIKLFIQVNIAEENQTLGPQNILRVSGPPIEEKHHGSPPVPAHPKWPQRRPGACPPRPRTPPP